MAVAAGKLPSRREDTEYSSRNRALSSTVSPLVLLCLGVILRGIMLCSSSCLAKLTSLILFCSACCTVLHVLQKEMALIMFCMLCSSSCSAKGTSLIMFCMFCCIEPTSNLTPLALYLSRTNLGHIFKP